MAKTKQKKKVVYLSWVRLLVFVLLVVCTTMLCLYFQAPIEKIINGRDVVTNEENIDYDGLLIHYIDVGQGDAIAIEFPDNKKMLIDAGKQKSSNQLLTYLNQKVFDDGTNEFEYVLLTHSDEDHIGGMQTIFNTYQVNNVYRPQIYINSTDASKDSLAPTSPRTVETKIYTNTINTIYAEPNCNVYFTELSLMNSTQKICGGEGDAYYEFVFYSPQLSYYENVNDFSPIMKLTYKNKTFLFTGDATTLGEAEAIDSDVSKVDILKVGHHGSNTSSSVAFLNKVNPTYAVIEVGADNSYGHPKTEIVNRLESLGTKIFRTDLNKNIIANVNGEGVLIICPNVAEKISVWYFICGVGAVEIYFCFFIKYGTNGQTEKAKRRKSN